MHSVESLVRAAHIHNDTLRAAALSCARIGLALLAAAPLFAQAALPLPPPGHPRVFVRQADLPALEARRQSPLLRTSWEALEHDPAPEAKALFGMLNNDAAQCRAAIKGTRALHASYRIDEAKADVTRDVGRVVLSTALVYDWCYAALDAGERQDWIAKIESLAANMEIVWPKLVQGSVTGHGTEAQLARDMLAAGIAVYDERPDIYRRVAERIIGQFKPARDFFYVGGYHHQGSSYGFYRYQWDMFATTLFARMGYPDVFTRDLGSAPYRWLYTRRPDGQLLRDGDDFMERYRPFGKYWDLKGQDYAASYFRDGYLMGDALKQGLIGTTPLFDVLLVDPGVAAKPVSELPLARYFAEPLGAITARTSWEDGIGADSVVADMKIGAVQFNNHQHLDAGSFQLYFKGPLAVNSGVYQGNQSNYGGEHFLNYYQRTIAHNTLLVRDPDQQFSWNGKALSNDGGQFYPADGHEAATLDELLANGQRRAAVRAHAIGPDPTQPEYTYLEGDLAGAYGTKLSAFQRAFVFLDLKSRTGSRAALVVFDRVRASQARFRKTWLLHTVEEPRIEGNVVTAKRIGNGYRGELQNTTLLPESGNLLSAKVGGPGHEFTVDGRNYPNALPEGDNSADGTAWRVELSPVRPSTDDLFLNVLQVKDATDPVAALPVSRIDAGPLVGALIGQRLVLFSRDAQALNAPVTLDLRAHTGELRILVTGLAPGRWRLSTNTGRAMQEVRVAEGSAYFSVKAGRYRLSPH